jgi:hypothetical protein
MPSIFIWKSSEPNTSKKTIRYYAGSNWALEDNDFSPKSYMFLEQIVIPGFNNSVITYRTQIMPQDWVGSELLEVSQVPYEFVKSDNYGTLEKIGSWMRFTSKYEINFTSDILQKELITIKNWINNKKSLQPQKKQHIEHIHHQNTSPFPPPLPPHQNVQINFQEFLIKYSFDSLPHIPVVSSTTSINDNNKSGYGNMSYNKNIRNNVNSYVNTRKK